MLELDQNCSYLDMSSLAEHSSLLHLFHHFFDEVCGALFGYLVIVLDEDTQLGDALILIGLTF